MAENNVPYLTLDPDVEEAIRADRAAGRTSPYRTDDDAVVRREDFAHDRPRSRARPSCATSRRS